MSEKVLDVLMYLFENYMDDSQEIGTEQETLSAELAQAGFPSGEINKAFTWLEELSVMRSTMPVGMVAPGSILSLRHYSPDETAKLTQECRGFILQLEQNGILDPYTRELVIDRIMALEEDEIDLEQLKWITLMVLFNQPGQESAHALLEDMVMGDRHDCLQ